MKAGGLTSVRWFWDSWWKQRCVCLVYYSTLKTLEQNLGLSLCEMLIMCNLPLCLPQHLPLEFVLSSLLCSQVMMDTYWVTEGQQSKFWHCLWSVWLTTSMFCFCCFICIIRAHHVLLLGYLCCPFLHFCLELLREKLSAFLFFSWHIFKHLLLIEFPNIFSCFIN